MDPSLNSFLPKGLLQSQNPNAFKSNDPSTGIFNNQKPNPFSNNFEEPSTVKGNVKQEEDYSKDISDENLKDFQIPSKWEWLPCNYELKKEADGIETHWSLAPTIQLAGGDPKTCPAMDINIQLERNFMHSDELGWNWHKSWNLPNITTSIKITDPKTNEMILPPADLKAQLLAVKVLLNKAEQFKLYDLGLKGPAVQDLSEGQAVFSGIKFSSTSYNNDGVKFHLIVLIYIQDDVRSRACPKILYSRISPPIFVDSRKSARDSNMTKKVVHKYFDPFPPETFEKTFIKRNSKFNEAKEEIIENSLEGLSQYFTAPNIRNKVKHPIFLASKFSHCVKLYYNTSLIKSNDGQLLKEDDLIEKMQRIFMESHVKTKKSDSANANKAFDNKYFILLIEEPNNLDSFHLNKKISDYLDPIINDVLHVIFNSNIAPPHFKEVPNTNLAKSYTKVYSTLIHIKNSYGGSLHEEGEKGKKTPQSKIRSIVCLSEDVNKKRALDSESEDEESKEDLPPEPVNQKKLKGTEQLEAAFKKVTINQPVQAKIDKISVKNEDAPLQPEGTTKDNDLKKILASNNISLLNNIASTLNKPTQINPLPQINQLNSISQMNQYLGGIQPEQKTDLLSQSNLLLNNVMKQTQPLLQNQQISNQNDILASLQQEQLKNQILMNYLVQSQSQQNMYKQQQQQSSNLLQNQNLLQSLTQQQTQNSIIPEKKDMFNPNLLLQQQVQQQQQQQQVQQQNQQQNQNNNLLRNLMPQQQNPNSILNNILMMNRGSMPNSNLNLLNSVNPLQNNLSQLTNNGGMNNLGGNNLLNQNLSMNSNSNTNGNNTMEMLLRQMGMKGNPK